MELYICNIKFGEIPFIVGTLTDTDVITINRDMLHTADFIELRIDMFSESSIDHIVNIFKTIKQKAKKPLIATVRDIREGGQKEIPERLSIFKAVLPFSEIIDVEILSEDIITNIKKDCLEQKKILIGSYHNFESTPEEGYLEDILSKGKSLGADIVKIAVTANNRDDLINILTFTQKNKDRGIITICMGEIGLPSRVISPIFGSLMTYGYFLTPSAPGQLSVSELLYIMRRLKIRRS